MKWNNLKLNICPKCEKEFPMSSFGVDYISCRCGFKISNKRMTEIVTSQVTAGLEKKWEQEIEEANL